MQALEKLTLRNTRFGDIEFDSNEVLRFSEGLIGFSNEREFLLLSTSSASSFVWLQSLSQPSLAFLLTDPNIYVADYRPSLRMAEGDRIYTTVNIPHGKPEEMTINLSGPICVNLGCKSGKQIVLDNEAYTTRYRVFATGRQESERVAA